MLDFTLFKIPVRVEPLFWLSGFLLGGGLSGSLDRAVLISILLWMLILFISILVHEFGHALVSRKLTGVTPSVKLWAMGGLAYPNTQLTRQQSFWVTWAGPLAGLAFFALTTLTCCLVYGFPGGSNVISFLMLPRDNITPAGALAFQAMNPVTFDILRALVFINFWWSLVNLLPVFPLDGGQIYAAVESSQKKVFQVGMVVGILVAIVAFFQFQLIFASLLFAYLAFQNYQRLQQLG